MKPLTKGLFTKTTASALALLLLLSILPPCAARHMPDWSRVQAVPPKTKTDVHLYKDEAHQGSRKIKGRFDSAAADSITLKLKDGQTRTLEKSGRAQGAHPSPVQRNGGRGGSPWGLPLQRWKSWKLVAKLSSDLTTRLRSAKTCKATQ